MFYENQQIGIYILIRKLGKGGFGEVWLAERRSRLVTKKVALKLPHEEQVNIETIRQEAELWEQASGHPNVLPIIDADIYDGQVVIVSEFADGGSLSDKLKTDGKLSVEKSVEMTIGILNGLEFLHYKRIIHRDIKPQNILLQGNTPRLADFGISRAIQTAAVSSTIIGTDSYMSPEAFDGKRSIQTDIWSVGVVLYQLLAGNLPFPQEHPSERMFAIFSKEFQPLSHEIPIELKKIVSRSLAKQPENRYQTTAEMRMDLQKALVGIAHPTLVKTEAFQFPIAPEIPPKITLPENNYESEKETVITNIPQVRQPEIQRAFAETQFRQIPFTENQPLQNHRDEFITTGQNTNSKTGYFEYVIFGTIAFLLLIGLIAVVLSNAPNTYEPQNASGASNVSSTPISGLPKKINIELRITGDPVTFESTVDGTHETFTLSSGPAKFFTPQQSFKLKYYKGFVDKVQLKINDKMIILPKADQVKSNIIEFEITKENFNQIYQNGKISQ